MVAAGKVRQNPAPAVTDHVLFRDALYPLDAQSLDANSGLRTLVHITSDHTSGIGGCRNKRVAGHFARRKNELPPGIAFHQASLFISSGISASPGSRFISVRRWNQASRRLSDSLLPHQGQNLII